MCRKIRCERSIKGSRCGKIAKGSYYCNSINQLPNDIRFWWNGNWCAEGSGDGVFLCNTCKVALKICDRCATEDCNDCDKD